MNKYTFIAMENVTSDIGDAYLEGDLDLVVTLLDDLLIIASNTKHSVQLALASKENEV